MDAQLKKNNHYYRERNYVKYKMSLCEIEKREVKIMNYRDRLEQRPKDFVQALQMSW